MSEAELEEWRAIPGYEGLYEASSLGRIRSLTFFSHGRRARAAPHILRPAPRGRDGYLGVMLSGQRGWYVHQLVLLTFVGPRPTPHHEAAHGNGIATDNRAANLRWATKLENEADRIAHGTVPGMSQTHCKRGHPLSGDNLYAHKEGRRQCATCKREAMRRRRAANV